MSARAVLVMLLVLAPAANASAQSVCLPIGPGDTAAVMAERLTGDARNRHASSFRVFDERWRPIAKNYYYRIQSGWLACIVDAPVPSAPAGALLSPSVPGALAAGGQPFASPGLSLDVSFLFVAALVFGALSVSRFAVLARRRRRERAQFLGRFGAEFVREFGRPLTQFRGGGALPRARLRISARRSRVEILLAPADGRNYPNLSDHRRNVEYDVARVMAALRCESFVHGRPYAEGDWVVVPIHYKSPVKREGVR